MEKNKTQNLKFIFCKKKSVNLEEMTCIRIHFFQCGSRIQIRIRIEIKWIVSAGIPYLKAEKAIQSSDHGLEFPVVSQVTYLLGNPVLIILLYWNHFASRFLSIL